MGKKVLQAMLIVLIALIGTGCCESKEDEPKASEATFGQTLANLGSSDPASRTAAQKALVAFGPEKIDQIMEIRSFLDEVASRHGQLVAEPSGRQDLARVEKGADEAIKFFSSFGGVPYLALGTQSHVFYVRMNAAQAIAKLPDEVVEEDKQLIVRTGLSFLEKQPPVPQGGEPLVVQEEVVRQILELLGRLVGMGTQPKTRENVIRHARAWLESH
ncbi:MAG: hypothetical protein PVJ86_07285 [Phycisphaerales bacterium]|jgi:hypothetical protein